MGFLLVFLSEFLRKFFPVVPNCCSGISLGAYLIISLGIFYNTSPRMSVTVFQDLSWTFSPGVSSGVPFAIST